MDHTWLRRKINTVGVWYFVTFLKEVLENYNALQDGEKKQRFIEKTKDGAHGGEISDASASTKVNAVLSIIRARKVTEALQVIVEETSPTKVPMNTIENAVAILDGIKNGTIVLPQ